MNLLDMPPVILSRPGLTTYFVWILQIRFQISVGERRLAIPFYSPKFLLWLTKSFVILV
jgi:hypothetical protein